MQEQKSTTQNYNTYTLQYNYNTLHWLSYTNGATVAIIDIRLITFHLCNNYALYELFTNLFTWTI